MVHMALCPLILLNLADAATKLFFLNSTATPCTEKVLVGKQEILRVLLEYSPSLMSRQTCYVLGQPVVIFLPCLDIPFIPFLFATSCCPTISKILACWRISLIRHLMFPHLFFPCMCLFLL